MKKMIVMTVLLLVISSCGGGSWRKAGGDQQQFNSDKFYCQGQCTPISQSFRPSMNPIIMIDCMHECMTIKGWSKN